MFYVGQVETAVLSITAKQKKKDQEKNKEKEKEGEEEKMEVSFAPSLLRCSRLQLYGAFLRLLGKMTPSDACSHSL